MPDSIMYRSDSFVVLEPDRPEQFLSAEELLEKLKSALAERGDNLPPDLQKLETLEARAAYLLETYCEFDVTPERFLQWYAVRMEK